jgi:hypothetical protein
MASEEEVGDIHSGGDVGGFGDGEQGSGVASQEGQVVSPEVPGSVDSGLVPGQGDEDLAGIAAGLPPGVSYILSPTPSLDGEPVHMITVILRSSGDKTRDALRMRRIYGVLSTFPGNDRCAFHIFERGHGYLLEFPNFTTGWCPELISRLNFLVGADNVRVEPITFH